MSAPTLRQSLADRSNDYTELEARYREATGTDLVTEPSLSFSRGPTTITKSASVLIGSYNSAITLEKTLISLEASTFNRKYRDRFEVIVVDDGSTDATRDVVCSAKLDLHLLYIKQANAGLTRAHNTGLGFASNDIIIFSDSDMVHTPCAIEELMKRHEVLENVTLVGFRFEIDPGDTRLAPPRLREALPHLRPAFYHDFRLSFPAWPENMCRDTGHFKDFGHGRTIMMANGAS
jgi:glycosyltransferase involved in cell wall biosynthesis